MSSIDVVFLVIIGIFTGLGIWKGFFREVLGLAGIVLGIVFGIIFFGPVSKALSNFLPGIPAIIWPFISFVFIFAAIYIGSRLLAGVLAKISSAVMLGWLNRLLGGAIGALKGSILISIILILVGFFPFQKALQETRENSMLYEPLQRLVPFIYNISSNMTDKSKNFENKILKSLDDAKVKLSEEMIKYFLYGDSKSKDQQ